MNGSRINIGIVGDLQPGLNSDFFKVEIISTGKLVASQQEMIPTNSFHLVQVVDHVQNTLRRFTRPQR